VNRLLYMGLVSFGCTAFAFAGTDGSEADSEANRLEVVLKQEADGQLIDRRGQLLGDLLKEQTAWHAGMVQVEAGWKPFEEIKASPLDAEYEAKRAEYWDRPDGHLMMARWCKKNGLADRARSHYYAVVVANPNHAEARQGLGHVAVNGEWIDGQELATAQREMQESFEQLERWAPKLGKLLADIRSGQTKRMSAALTELEQMDAADALPALTAFAANIDDDLSRPLIRKISKLRSADACRALVKIALVHPSSEIRLVSAKAIKSYSEHHYIPMLLAMLSGETEVSNQLVMYPNGTVAMESLVTTELQNKRVARRVQDVVNVISTFDSSRAIDLHQGHITDWSYWSVMFEIPRNNPLHVGEIATTDHSNRIERNKSRTYVPAEVLSNAAMSMKEKSQQLERAKEVRNRTNASHVNNVCALLRATTGESFGDEPQAWWTWWNDRNERYEGTKPVDFVASQNYKQLGVQTSKRTRDVSLSFEHRGKSVVQWSCLVPGTEVQTSGGLVAIEKIKVGDMVLSQDVETGELNYKPVLMTTVRPPKSTIQIVTDTDTIEATGGHNWWVSGLGWTMTSRLEPGMSLHTATGAIKIKELIPVEEKKETFNLVVDRYNTYFVGPERVLSFDNTQLRPSLCTLPGYNEQ
jgi:hypothetical protein